MADDLFGGRSARIDQRTVARGSNNRRAACLLIVAVGLPANQLLTLPTVSYSYTLVVPTVSNGGAQSLSVPTLAYAYTLPVPNVVSTSDPASIVAVSRTIKIGTQRVVQRGGVPKAGIFTIALQPANGNFLTLPTLGYTYSLSPAYVISNPGMLYLGGDDGKWPSPPGYTKRVNKGVLLALESGNQNLPLPTLAYTYTLVTPAVQVSGAQSLTLPTLTYTYDLPVPGLPQNVQLPTLNYSYTLVAPIIAADPIVGPCLVIAWKRGWFGEQIREIDDQFTIRTPYEFSPYWMHFIDPIPATWAPFIQPYVQHLDDEMLDFDGF